MKDALPRVLGVARRLLRDESAGWDAAQEAFVKAWRGIAGFRGEAAFASWVAGIAVRVGLDRLRAESREAQEEVPEVADTASPAAEAETRELGAAIRAAVESLPAGERAVFLLHHEAEKRYHEIAAELAIPIGTVMSRLHAARQRLRRELEGHWKEWKS